MESIRCSPAAWFTLPEYSTRDRRIGGFLLPANMAAVIDWKRLNTNAAVWNPPGAKYDGTTFYPERFAHLKPSQYRYSFLQFGIGTRKCIGKNFAVLIMKLVLVNLLQSYRLEALDGDKEICLEEGRFTRTPKKAVRFVKL